MWLDILSIIFMFALAIYIGRKRDAAKSPDGPGELQINVKETER